jgi:membrane fusion protein (multidrug efflux system)
VAEAEAGIRVAESKLVQARAGEQQSQAELRTAQTGPSQVAATKARASSAEARVQQARATLAQAELNLQYATVKAPARGVVSKKSVNVGQVVQAGQPLMAVVQVDDVWITANFKETQLKDVRPGQRAAVTVDAYGGRRYNGKVDSIAGAYRRAVQSAAARKCHREFRQGGAAHPRQDRARSRAGSRTSAPPGMSVVPTVYTK